MQSRHWSSSRWFRIAVMIALIAVGLGVRYAFRDERTMDYEAFLSRWYDTLEQQGTDAFRTKFADYNYPYLYFLGVLAWLHVPSLIGIKLVSVAFDFLLGFFAYRIVALRTDRFSLKALAFALVTLLPSVVVNSAYWGQADAIYSAFALGAVYFLMRRNPWWACVFFGIALAFKLQAIFLLPLLLWLVLRRHIPWYTLLAAPVAFVLLDVPALIFGAPLHDAVSVYADQTGSYQKLTLNAANLYQLIPLSGDVTWVARTGIVAAGALVVAFLAWSVWKKPAVTSSSILVVATASATIVPFLLPAMHDRYFYLAEVLSVVMAFYLPMRYWIIPVLIQASAIGVYYSSLAGGQGQGFGGAGRPNGVPAGGQPGSGGSGGMAPGGDEHGRPGGGGGHGGGGNPGGMPGGSGGGYTSGKGDGLLSFCAAMTAAAVLGLLDALRTRVRPTRDTSGGSAQNAAPQQRSHGEHGGLGVDRRVQGVFDDDCVDRADVGGPVQVGGGADGQSAFGGRGDR
ncbi:MAG: glycosyltransferase 87 family protein [Gordonia sp. (in: high G+C Gram-positive bacteria)]